MRPPLYLNRAIAQIHDLASETPTEEICGIIISGKLYPSRNVAQGVIHLQDGSTLERSPATHFELDRGTFSTWEEAIARKENVVIYHSHVSPEDTDFSASDVDNARATGCPWLLVHPPSGSIQYFDPTAIEPYEEREWHWAYGNCYTIVRDWLKAEMDFDLWAPTPEKENAYHDHSWNEISIHGDRQLEKIPRDFSSIQRGDILTMRLDDQAIAPHHLAVVVDAERGLMLHHLTDQLSCIRPLTPAYQKATHQIYRIPAKANA